MKFKNWKSNNSKKIEKKEEFKYIINNKLKFCYITLQKKINESIKKKRNRWINK